MKISKNTIVVFISMVCFASYAHSEGFQSFSNEGRSASKQLGCDNPRIYPASSSLGALYSCIQGRAETVKWFINEIPHTNRVKNVKVMWNDWFKDVGYGIHADKQNVKTSLAAISKLYAPNHKKEIKNMFFSNNNTTIISKKFRLKYTYTRGPSIDERLIVVTDR